MQDSFSAVRKLFEEKKLRLTPQREAVFKILLSYSDQHLTAEAIFEHSRATYPELGLATIYRTLELFESLGLISRLEFGDGGRRYEVALGKDHHHLLCMDCGKIEEFSEDLLDELQETLTNDSGFHIVNHSLRFFGYCSNCKEKHLDKE